ncbi:dUTP diphosphatase [Tessaracoccus rhinocerotis]|uniref:Deoxyuridine 5'-triphosphate nucleotidohydrolase n=1 Tax=Tessaracoccus rhinocerotis TaxID=1689449 RepID=A0A553K3S4_9ACTN|nr:dUTP diphosphatase [Tessaracoccus rhinocerotis]TRY19360.1 dUTP diphosphatase [Tessaracoccus rhinocerotis]
MNIPVVLDSPEQLPTYARAGDAGADLRSTQDITIAPGERALVGTGVRVALPEGHVGLVTPRSGLAARTGLSIVNAPGVIDSGYRGEVLVCLVNLDPRHPVEVSAGDRIAQLLVMPFVTASFTPVHDLDETERGSGGYGSTGVGHQIHELPGRPNK